MSKENFEASLTEAKQRGELEWQADDTGLGLGLGAGSESSGGSVPAGQRVPQASKAASSGDTGRGLGRGSETRLFGPGVVAVLKARAPSPSVNHSTAAAR